MAEEGLVYIGGCGDGDHMYISVWEREGQPADTDIHTAPVVTPTLDLPLLQVTPTYTDIHAAPVVTPTLDLPLLQVTPRH